MAIAATRRRVVHSQQPLTAPTDVAARWRSHRAQSRDGADRVAPARGPLRAVGGSYFLIEVALLEIGPLHIALGRVGLAALALTAFVYASGRRMPDAAGTWLALFVMDGLNNVIPFSLIAWGQVHIDSAMAAILTATAPQFSVCLAHLLTSDEPLTPARLGGVLIGLAGVIVLIGSSALEGIGWRNLGQLAVVGASVSYACASVFGKRFKALAPSVAAAGMLTGSTVVLLVLVLAVEGASLPRAGLTSVAAVVALALSSTALAYLIYFRILAAAGATNLLLVTFLIPVTAVALGVLVLDEQLHRNDLSGTALIFAGLAAVDGRAVFWLRRRFAGTSRR